MRTGSYFGYLPEKYKLSRTVDLQNNKKLALWVNLGALLLLIPFAVIFFAVSPVGDFDLFRDDTALYMPLVFLLLFFVLYTATLFLHELIHGFCFRLLSGGVRPSYGFTGLYAYAANKNGYYRRREYLVIGLAPAVIINIAYLIPLFFTEGSVFTMFYLLLALHFSGCAGDIYVTWVLMKKYFPSSLIRDEGTKMEVYDENTV